MKRKRTARFAVGIPHSWRGPIYPFVLQLIAQSGQESVQVTVNVERRGIAEETGDAGGGLIFLKPEREEKPVAGRQ